MALKAAAHRAVPSGASAKFVDVNVALASQLEAQDYADQADAGDAKRMEEGVHGAWRRDAPMAKRRDRRSREVQCCPSAKQRGGAGCIRSTSSSGVLMGARVFEDIA